MNELNVIFSRIAQDYDKYCDIFSLFLHRYWKRKFTEIACNHIEDECLDLASGTGDIPLRIGKTKLANSSNIRFSVTDTCPQMTNVAREKIAKLLNCQIEFEFNQVDATDMRDIPDNSTKLITMAFAMKIIDRQKAIAEIYRCLRPGGIFINIDASRIPNRLVQQAYLRYMRIVIPFMGRVVANGNKDAYEHLLNGIEAFPNASEFSQELTLHGFELVKMKRLTLGIVAIHCVQKPIASCRY